MWMIDIGEDEEIIYPDEMEDEPAIPITLPETVPVELPWLS